MNYYNSSVTEEEDNESDHAVTESRLIGGNRFDQDRNANLLVEGQSNQICTSSSAARDYNTHLDSTQNNLLSDSCQRLEELRNISMPTEFNLSMGLQVKKDVSLEVLQP